METNQELKERYFSGDNDIERCYLCDEIQYINKMEKVSGEWYCGCDIEGEDIPALIKRTKEREKRVTGNIKTALELHPLFQEILNTYKPKSI